MSSNPHSDDADRPAAEHDAGATGADAPDQQAQPTEVIHSGTKKSDKPGDPGELAGADDATVVAKPAAPGADDGKTEVIPGQGTAQPAEWWQETEQFGAAEGSRAPETERYEQATVALGQQSPNAPEATEVLPVPGDTGEHPTRALHPGDAAYAAAPGAAPVAAGAQVPPGTPPPPANTTGGQGGSPRKGRKRRTALIIGVVVAMVLVGGLAFGEAYARRTVENCIASQFEQQMGSKIDVSFGAKPMLVTMLDKKVGSVTVDSDDTKFGPAVGMKVHAVFNDLEMQDDGRQGGSVGSSEAEVSWSNDGIAKTMGGLVSGVTSDPKAGTLNFAVLAGLAELQIKPKVVGDKIEVETVSAALLGIGLPTDLVSGIVELMTESLQSYPMGLQPTKIEITSDGLHVSLRGGPTKLEPVEGQQQQVTELRC
ncbi:LmeA family phospholipid-binding protein [Nocardia sp. NPDC005978]|uniref:LmeA family phospholipid-binding protein n=1 Tax=Nocardia sp. NPDC005978 TaxID=3156725 RepID=UPI0033AA8D7A